MTSLFSKVSGGYDEVWKAIIRPPRDDYKDEELGPKEFVLNGKAITRTDFDLKNKRGLTLKCSFFARRKKICDAPPCVLYLHGNSSCRVEALPAVEVLLPSNINVLCFDFAGCGHSEGEYISLGWYEKDDVEIVIEHMRKMNWASTVGIWGRSMGAVSALMHADRDPTIAGMVLDSPFSNLRVLSEELVKSYSDVPGILVSAGLAMVRKTIQSKANFDIDHISPIDHVKNCYVPAYFLAAKGDKFVLPHHAEDLHVKYAGDKKFITVDGDHNSMRPQFANDSIAIFLYNTLQVETMIKLGGGESKAYEEESPAELAGLMPFAAFKYAHQSNEKNVAGLIGDFDDDEMKKAIAMSMEDAKDKKDVEKALAGK